MIRINNQKELSDVYSGYYKTGDPPVANRFPCLLKVSAEGGGLAGEYWDFQILYCPINLDFHSWAAGVMDGEKYA